MAIFTPSELLKKKKEDVDALSEQQKNYGAYQESDYVKGLRDAALADKSALDTFGDFQFSKQHLYDTLENSLLNRPKFSYDVGGDSLYQMYKDKYIKGAKLAMQDTMGQAAALTGGYGNSYAATVGNQAYQSYLGQLNDVIPELYQLAMQRYQMEGDQIKDNLSLLSADRSTELSDYNNRYSRLSDTYNRNYGLYGDERNRENTAFETGYNRLVDSLNYASNDYNNEYNRAYEDYRNDIADQQAAASLAAQRAASNQSAEIANLKAYIKQLESGGGTEEEEPLSLYNYSRKDDENGVTYFYKDGKEYKFQTGFNPYTSTVNKDIYNFNGNGAFSNGYQPNNINGKKLTETGDTITVNGRNQKVWKTPDGKRWYWDGTANEYKSAEYLYQK